MIRPTALMREQKQKQPRGDHGTCYRLAQMVPRSRFGRLVLSLFLTSACSSSGRPDLRPDANSPSRDASSSDTAASSDALTMRDGARDVSRDGSSLDEVGLTDSDASDGSSHDGGASDGSPDADAPGVSDDAHPDAPDAAAAADRPTDASGSDAGATFFPWPGSADVTVVDKADVFGMDVSGLAYQTGDTATPDRLWALQNGTSKLFLLGATGPIFEPVADAAWATGKTLHFPHAEGSPDAEGLTLAEAGATAIYVSTERDNEVKSTSRMSVLRFDLSVTGSVLSATHEWNLTKDLPVSDPNKGLEGVAWIPDSYLVARGFYDEGRNGLYDPTAYEGHGNGLFFVGLESNGFIYGYALNHNDGTYQRVASFDGGQGTLVDLAFDRDVGTLWSYCDDACGNRAVLFDIDVAAGSATQGRFVRRIGFNRPAGLPNAGNEGITFAPESACDQGRKAFYWSDDSNTDGHALRRGDIPCGPLDMLLR